MEMNSHPSTRPENSDPDLLGIYLNDHLAGAAAGVELVRRIVRAHRGRDYEPQLAELAREIREDRRTLRACMEALGVRRLRSRTVLGWTMERLGRLKLNGRVLSRSPLSDVLELEAMRLGVEGKGACWRTLHALARTDGRLDADQLEELVQRARRQSQSLEALRARVAGQVLTPPTAH
ncbi:MULTISPECIES: hypothetical protein [Streptomyces]|uniref:hypothetical protein n=1 Tax=Streptomyces TaxID=1883 RepID=UPI001316D0B3|nr:MULTISPECIES: hypothetical protein [Streptomyces]QGZ47704.1 hypothetical protein GPZ77_04260 [Streptomyces sp. QHH-9511]GGT93809.1 hypothetical protein GCM10010272_43410 [Streptomyces lateritius]